MINSIGTRERRKINFLARPEPGVFIIRERRDTAETTLLLETMQTTIIQ